MEGEENRLKKIKRGSSCSMSMANVEGASIYDLPPEVLTEILKCVDSPSLLKHCRLVNRSWSSISSGILCKRPENKISFELNFNELVWGLKLNTAHERGPKRLIQFVECIRNSQNCPFAHFSFGVIDFSAQTKLFHNKDFLEFLSEFPGSNQNSSQNQIRKSKIKCIQMRFRHLKQINKVEFFAEQLGDLLLNKVPLLEHLELDFRGSVEAPQVKLFPANAVQVPAPVPAQFQLAHLKTVSFSSPVMSSYTQIVTDLLNSAVNLTRIHMVATRPGDFQFLRSLGKLPLGKLSLVKRAVIDIGQDFFSSSENPPSSKLGLALPKLEFLDLMLSMTEYDHVFLTRTGNFLGNLFESSKDSLKTLSVQPFGFLSSLQLQLPTFKNLRELTISRHHNQTGVCNERIFPPGIRQVSSHVFPAVDLLNLRIQDWTAAFPQEDSIPILPNLKSLSLTDRRMTAGVISILALMCPNLKKLEIKKKEDGAAELNFAQVGRAIWTHMKQLESLKVDMDVAQTQREDGSNDLATDMDSCFTGISMENCQRLSKKMAKPGPKSQKRKCLAEIEDSELRELTLREYPAISDMKDLKRLILSPYVGKRLVRKDKFGGKKWTWISRDYGFKLLPHLKVITNLKKREEVGRS